ncbi:L,D-transpeptidase [Seohaeicola saemankumensis]|nr:L,D-transpeptidase [Seohaeicola saemankumensis]MCA0871899.1 L,D-transpeptidase [Seohaeicola saemankumensis]
MRGLVIALLLALVCALPGPLRAAPLEAWIDKSEQMMTVFHNDRLLYRWPVSTARPGKVTPTGVFTPQSMKRMHYSTLYNNAPMPFSIFFHGNYAVHGTTQIDKLGCVASAGCVRLHPDNAEILFNLTRETGMENTRIIIQD